MEIYQLQPPSDAFAHAMDKLMIAYNMEKLGDVGTTATIQLGLRNHDGDEVEGGLKGGNLLELAHYLPTSDSTRS